MAALIVPCPHCLKPSRLDSERLPDGPACFACPSCKKKVVVDKRHLMTGEADAAAPKPATIPSTAPADRRFPGLPADATFPSGIILGEDDAVIDEVQKMLAALGSEAERVGSPEQARQVIIREQPDLCIYVGRKVPDPPYAPMAPLTGLPPTYRRRLYLVLVADNLETLNGIAAFMYEVNLILAKKDFSQFGAALHCGIDHHNRLCEPFFKAAEKKGSL